MQFHSMTFIWFLVPVLVLYYVLREAHTKYLILAASYLFYGWWNYKFVDLILGSTVINYYTAILFSILEEKKQRKYLLLFNVIFNVGLLGIFKYFNFFSQSFSELLSSIGFHRNFVPVNIVLPLGISFLTFQVISYIVDVYSNKIVPERDFIVFASFVAFFPKVVSGPIERAGDLLPQIRKRPPFYKQYITEGGWLILWGYFLKIFMADNLGTIVDSMYSNYRTLSGFDVILCNYAYAFQIFGDFAGYSYIAVGVGKLFGITLNDNFRFPYFVKTPSEFWRNWHISLSTWLRDYLYIPLGGSRCSKSLTYRNLLLTMTLAGLWHGAAWSFVFWGIFQGIMLIAFRALGSETSTTSKSSIKSLLQIFIMFNITCAGWMIFRTPSMAVFITMVKHVFLGFPGQAYRTFYWGMSFLLFVSVPLSIHILQFTHKKTLSLPFERSLSRMSCCMTVVFLLLIMGSWGGGTFIYLQF